MARPRRLAVQSGDRFGQLEVVEELTGQTRRAVRVRCSCEAATEKVVALTSLVSGATKSCGCLNRAVAAQNQIARNKARTLPPDLRKRYRRREPRFRIDDGGRECSVCTVYKPWSNYNKGNGARHFSSWCRQCAREHHHRKPLERRRAISLRNRLKRFNLTVEQYEVLCSVYGNCCWRCRRPETALGPGGRVQRLSVDHDHACCPGDGSCGKCIRGVLCVGCNFVLGRIDGGQLASYLQYLARGFVDLDQIV